MNHNVNKTLPYLHAYRAIRSSLTRSRSPCRPEYIPDHVAQQLLSFISGALDIPEDIVAKKLADGDELNREYEDEYWAEQMHKFNMSLTKQDAYDDETPPD